jgi:hypothetical protein
MSVEIPKEELFEHVKISASMVTLACLPGTQAWQNAKISKLPTKIFDINGELLFQDYPISSEKENRVVGNVRAGVRKDLGSPITAYELGERYWNFDASVEKLKPIFSKKFPKLKVTDIKLVCYSYPKLGVMFQAIDPSGAVSRQIYDVASLTAVPERNERKAVEGFYAWSYLDSLKEVKSLRLRRFEQVKKKLMEIPEVERMAMLKADVFRKYTVESKYFDAIFKLIQTKLLQYCTHYNYNEVRSHHCFVLQGQEVDDYCAVATCQMILCYYRYYYTQNQIAPALGYSAGSGCPSDQSPGYKSLTCNHLNAVFDNTPTFAEAKAQIDALRPFKSGISGHARACTGYSSNLLTGVNRLYIYDPWPWNANFKLAGTVTWEDWDSPVKTNFVTTKLTCP